MQGHIHDQLSDTACIVECWHGIPLLNKSFPQNFAEPQCILWHTNVHFWNMCHSSYKQQVYAPSAFVKMMWLLGSRFNEEFYPKHIDYRDSVVAAVITAKWLLGSGGMFTISVFAPQIQFAIYTNAVDNFDK